MRTTSVGMAIGLMAIAMVSQAGAEMNAPASGGTAEPAGAGMAGGPRGKLAERMKAGDPGAGRAMEGLIERLVNNPKLTAEIGLTEAQLTTLKTALEDLRREEKELRAQQESGGLEQAKLLSQDTVDEAAVMAAVERAGKARTEMAKLLVKQLLVVKRTLTPEQMTRIKEIIRQRVSAKAGEAGGKERRERIEGWKARRGNREWKNGEDKRPAAGGTNAPAAAVPVAP